MIDQRLLELIDGFDRAAKPDRRPSEKLRAKEWVERDPTQEKDDATIGQ